MLKHSKIPGKDVKINYNFSSVNNNIINSDRSWKNQKLEKDGIKDS